MTYFYELLKIPKLKDETKSSTSAPRPDWKREGECHLRCHQGSAPAFASYLKGFLTHRCSQTGEFSSSLLLYQIPSCARWLFQSELAQDFDHLVGCWLVAGGGKFQRQPNLQLSRPTIIIRPRYHCLQYGRRNWEISIFNVDAGPISILPISGNCKISMGGRRDVSGLIPGRRIGGSSTNRVGHYWTLTTTTAAAAY